MQISHEDSRTQQVTFGTSSSRVARMGDSAAFFHIMAASLYTRPCLAAAREIICNADDAHKMSGIDRPVSITVDGEAQQVTIRDFGPGIPDDKMDDIYLVFGESTKKDVSEGTGGFGLGSKAPWAIVSDFTVVSRHAGTETGYLLVKSDPDNDNKPSIQTLWTRPTQETGLSVTISLGEHYSQFLIHLKACIKLGGIRAKFEGEIHEHPVIPLSTMPGGMLVASNDSIIVALSTATTSNNARVYVRYGAVLYPVPNSNHCFPHIPDHVWIAQAAPDTLSLAPSREGLVFNSVTQETLDELSRLANDFLRSIPQLKIPAEELISRTARRVAKEAAEQAGDFRPMRYSTKFRDELAKDLCRQEPDQGLHGILTWHAGEVELKNTGLINHLLDVLLIEQDLLRAKWPASQARQLANYIRFARQDLGSLRQVKKELRKLLKALPADMRVMCPEETYTTGSIDMLSRPQLVSRILGQRRNYWNSRRAVHACVSRKLIIFRINDDLPGYIPGDRLCVRTSSDTKAKQLTEAFEEIGWTVQDVRSEAPRTKKTVSIAKKSGKYLCAATALTSAGRWKPARCLELKVEDRIYIDNPVAALQSSFGSEAVYSPVWLTDGAQDFMKQVAITNTERGWIALLAKGIPSLKEYVSARLDADPKMKDAFLLATNLVYAGIDHKDYLYDVLRNEGAHSNYAKAWRMLCADMTGVDLSELTLLINLTKTSIGCGDETHTNTGRLKPRKYIGYAELLDDLATGQITLEDTLTYFDRIQA